MEKIEWFQMLNKALKGDPEAIEYVKANQVEMNAKYTGSKPAKKAEEKPRETKGERKARMKKERAEKEED